MRQILSFLLILSVSVQLNASRAPQVTLTRLDDRVRVEIAGQHFTDYIFKGASRPYCYPILTPDGTSLVRDFPEKDAPHEEPDHKHQRALMFAHGDVNKIDFWNEGTSGTKFPKGLTVHDGIVSTTNGPIGELHVRNRWTAPTGELIATDETTLRFHSATDLDARFLDYEVTIHALPDQPLVLGDNKEGVIALRVAQWMVLPHRQGGKDWPGTGHILTSTGERDAAAWGKRAAWCAYYAERDGKPYGVALFDHPQNLRHPAWWMARDYGLLAANPFGQSSFESTKDKPLPSDLGNYTIPAGGTLTLRYRFYFFSGTPDSANVARQFTDYALPAKTVASTGFDERLYFNDADEVRLLAANPPENWHPQFGEAMTHLILHASGRSSEYSEDRKDPLVLALADGKTPRQLMILGYVLRLEVLNRAQAEDERHIARKEKLNEEDSDEESRKFFELRLDRGRTYIDYCQRQISDLLKKPNS